MPFNFRCLATLSAFKSGSFASFHSKNCSHVKPSCCFSHYQMWLLCVVSIIIQQWELFWDSAIENVDIQKVFFLMERFVLSMQADEWKNNGGFYGEINFLIWYRRDCIRVNVVWNLMYAWCIVCDKALIESNGKIVCGKGGRAWLSELMANRGCLWLYFFKFFFF